MSFSPREVVVAAGDGEVVTALGSRYVFEPLGHHTGGAFSLVEETLLDSDGPPLHEHEHEHEHEEETFSVLDGRGLFVEVEQRERAGVELDEQGVVALAAERGTRIVGPPIGC